MSDWLGTPASPLLDAAAARLAERAGVTRIADVTALDRIGVPVVMVVRPASRSFVVSQGKGLTREAAAISGLMESLEGFCAENPRGPFLYRSPMEMAALGRCVDPRELPRARRPRLQPGERLFWIEGRSLRDGASVWTPLESVHTDYVVPSGVVPGHVLVSSTGLGAGFDRDAAVLHALCEVVERDAFSLFAASQGWTDPARKLDLEGVRDGAAGALLARLRSADIETHGWDMTSDIGVPSVCVTLVDQHVPGGSLLRLTSGVACHPCPGRVLAAALLEAIQSRATAIAGSRDDLRHADYRDGGTGLVAAQAWAGAPARTPWSGAEDGADSHTMLETVLARLEARGFREAVAVRLDDGLDGVIVVRVVVPGLEGPHLHPDYRPGPRAKAAAA